MKIRLLKKVKDDLIELAVANGKSIYLTLTHIKSVHTP
jgi:phage-related protein